MTDINPTLNAEDIVDDIEDQREALDAEGDRWIVEGERKAFAREQGLRQALRNDIDTGRDWARDRASLARSRIEEEPLKATLYALGAGVLLGILLRR